MIGVISILSPALLRIQNKYLKSSILGKVMKKCLGENLSFLRRIILMVNSSKSFH